MESSAYTLGSLDALLAFNGTKEAWAKALMPVLSAATGALLAPEGETLQGATLGGLGALGAQSAMHAGARKFKNIFTAKHSADISMGIGIPGTGGSLGVKDQRERLPGMSRWVPRSTIERGFNYANAELDPQAVAELEANRGSISHPLLGAALAAAGARMSLPQSGVLGPVLAGLAGAGAGTLYHQATRGRRIEEGLEALQGAQREREKFPIRRHATQTANESTPLAVARGSGDA
jgi:hypothetical protein